MKNWKRAVFALTAALTLMAHCTAITIKADEITLDQDSQPAFTGKYGYAASEMGVGGEISESDNAPNMWKMNGNLVFCFDAFNGTNTDSIYVDKVPIGQFLKDKAANASELEFSKKSFSDEEINRVAAYAYYGIHEVPTGYEPLYYTAAQFIIWNEIHEVDNEDGTKTPPFTIKEMNAEDKKALEDAAAEIRRKAEDAALKFKFDGNVYIPDDPDAVQEILGDLSKSDSPSVYIQKYLSIGQAATSPSVQFSFTIDGNDVTENNIYSGKDETAVKGKPTIGSAVFTPQSTVQENRDGNYAFSRVNLNFDEVVFLKAGTFQYVIRENPDGYEAQGGTARILNVFVSDLKGVNSITDYELLTMDGQKSDGFVNVQPPVDLTLKKKVSGSQASNSEYFQFDIKLNGLTPGKAYEIAWNGTKKNAAYPNSESVKADENGSAQFTYWLKSEESMTIKELERNASYEIKEDKSKENCALYDTSVKLSGDTTSNEGKINLNQSDCSIKDDALTDSVSIEFENHRDGIVPTGVHMPIWPYVGILCGSCFLIGVLLWGRRKG